jgi:hypothetical protein
MIEEWLKALEIDDMCQWDVLVFLHRHRTALLSAENMARFMCYGSGPVVDALEDLASKGLVERSRLSQGARWYQLIPLDGPQQRSFERLMDLSQSRAGRLAVTEQLHKMSQHAAVVITARAGKCQGNVNSLRGQYLLASGKEAKKWPKAI